jgi:hypothetical protein
VFVTGKAVHEYIAIPYEDNFDHRFAYKIEIKQGF